MEDESFCDGELISIANGYITEMQDIITVLKNKLKNAEQNCINKTCVVLKDKEDCVAQLTELEKDKQYFSDSLDKQIEATLKLQKDYQELEKKNHEILKNSLDISNQFDELEEKLANADYQLEGRDVTIKELEAQIEKMKCCQNCKYFKCCDSNHYYCSLYCGLECEYDKSYKNWEIKEK